MNIISVVSLAAVLLISSRSLADKVHLRQMFGSR